MKLKRVMNAPTMMRHATANTGRHVATATATTRHATTTPEQEIITLYKCRLHVTLNELLHSGNDVYI